MNPPEVCLVRALTFCRSRPPNVRSRPLVANVLEPYWFAVIRYRRGHKLYIIIHVGYIGLMVRVFEVVRVDANLLQQ